MKNKPFYITLFYFMLLSSCYITFNKSKLNFIDVKYLDTSMFNMKTNGYYYFLGSDSIVSHITYVNRVQVAKYKPRKYVLPISFYKSQTLAQYGSFSDNIPIVSPSQQNFINDSLYRTPFIHFEKEYLDNMNPNSYGLIDWCSYRTLALASVNRSVTCEDR